MTATILITLGLSAVLLAGLITLSWIDIRTYRLPDILTLPLIGLGLIGSFIIFRDLPSGLIGAIAGYGSFVAIEKGFKFLRGYDGLGRGDAKLLAVGGAWCGWMSLPMIVLIGSVSGLTLILAFSKFRESGRIAFGPFLAFGIALTYVTRLMPLIM